MNIPSIFTQAGFFRIFFYGKIERLKFWLCLTTLYGAGVDARQVPFSRHAIGTKRITDRAHAVVTMTFPSVRGR
jgi:hypothetical protein